MGSENEMIPCLDFRRGGGLGLEEEGGEWWWKEISKKVREACESHGCFVFICDEIPSGLPEEMFMGMKTLFDLPEETKQKYTSPVPFRSYNAKSPITPFFESFGIDDAPVPATTQAFTNLMWPQGNPPFCETLRSMSSKMLELSFLILKMIMVGYGLPQHHASDVENMKSNGSLRLIKYEVPKSNNDSEITLPAHTDKSALAILCENEVQGLQVQAKTGKWIELKIPQEGFVVIIGDILKAWSNGRLHAVTHRVVMSEGEERYSLGLFAVPKDEVEIKVPLELVDDKMHPLRYRPFNYGEYINYYFSTLKHDALEVFAGV